MAVSIVAIFDSFGLGNLGLTDEIRDLNIDVAMCQTSASFYGCRYNQAVALRAAHGVVMSDPVTYSEYRNNGVVLKTEGKQTIQYGRNAIGERLANDTLAQTSFGMQLVALMRMSSPTMGVANVGSFGVIL